MKAFPELGKYLISDSSDIIVKQFKATGNEKTITMEIYETDEEDRVYTILKEKISLKSYIYR